MQKWIDLKGRKFGRLTVIERKYPNVNGNAVWLCKCECGIEIIVKSNALRSRNTKSCGCLKRDLTIKRLCLKPGLANMRQVLGAYRRHAERRGLEWNLTEEQFREITQRDCYYCGAKPNNVINKRSSFGSYTYNGMDRIDNSKGYTRNNIVSCCKYCNIAKNNMTLQEFRKWARKLYNKFIKIGGDKL